MSSKKFPIKTLPRGVSGATSDYPFGLIGLDPLGRVRNTTEMWFSSKADRSKFRKGCQQGGAYTHYAHMELQTGDEE